MALGAVLLIGFFGVGACVVTFITTGAEPELRITLTEIEPGTPRFEPITSWGADDDGFTYGIWVTQISGTGTFAYFSRQVDSGCHVQWQATETAGDVTGLFRDRCGNSVYSIDGTVISGPATRNLDHFEVTVADGEVIVDFSVLRIGTCRADPDPDEAICTPEGGLTTRSVPQHKLLSDDFARR